jgi:hypothetical protein
MLEEESIDKKVTALINSVNSSNKDSKSSKKSSYEEDEDDDEIVSSNIMVELPA